MGKIRGTHRTVKFSNVVDGDTIRVFLDDSDDQDITLRLLCLDTEESFAGGTKPVTPLGLRAKNRAAAFFNGKETVTIEFPGNEPYEVCQRKYRDNFGRLLVFVHQDEVDFQEVMIREGLSPYFMKYGHAVFAGHHIRYESAERAAQMAHLGVWDQIGNNNAEMRNYAVLSSWWRLRARIIDDFRYLKTVDDTLLDALTDYDKVAQFAAQSKTGTVFAELTGISRAGSRGGLISIGTDEYPFHLYIPNMTSDTGQEIVRLALSRYISDGEEYPRQSYAFITGEFSLYNDNPQIILSSAAQLTDRVGQSHQGNRAVVRIAAVLPNPEGTDAGNETFTLVNPGNGSVSLDGWTVVDKANRRQALSGKIAPRTETAYTSKVPLNNTGDTLCLVTPENQVADTVSYSKSDVATGQEIRFFG